MQLIHLTEAEFTQLTPRAVRVLLYLSQISPKSRRVVGTIAEAALRAGCSERTWRRGAAELHELGLISIAVTTNGYQAHVPLRKRWTWVPTLRDGSIFAMTDSALRVLLAICRCAFNNSRSARIRIETIANLINRSRRTVQLALRELRNSGVLSSYRTGRSSWYVVWKNVGEAFRETQIAHRSRLLLRLLSSSKQDEITWALSRLRDSTKAASVRGGAGWMPKKGETWRRAELMRLGVEFDDANDLLCRYDVFEIDRAILALNSRPKSRAAAWVRRMLDHGRFQGWRT